MFRGHSVRSLDPKGRLMLPPDYREIIMKQSPEGKLMVTKFDGCVVGYPLTEWEQIENSFSKLNAFDPLVRDFHRFFISGAVEVSLDKQGRMLVPPYLREYGGLGREVALVGVIRKFEIWDKDAFETKMAQMDSQDVMNRMAEKGFELPL